MRFDNEACDKMSAKDGIFSKTILFLSIIAYLLTSSQYFFYGSLVCLMRRGSGNYRLQTFLDQSYLDLKKKTRCIYSMDLNLAFCMSVRFLI